MSKIFEWLAVLSLLGAVWLALITNKIESVFVRQNYNIVLLSPLIFAILFGLFSVWIVLYRALKIKDCNEAEAELQKEIVQAREDLSKRGFKFERD